MASVFLELSYGGAVTCETSTSVTILNAEYDDNESAWLSLLIPGAPIA